jgi:gamma-glutamylcyclotransferase (GGCT)/AIG2-like uncharacterized protein YtfP
MNLFAYGTLMYPEMWRRVVGREFPAEPAELAGYAVYRVADGVYPVLVAAQADARVRGLVFRDLDAAAFQRLDEYESDLYDRTAVSAVAADGRLIRCQAYVLPAARRAWASDEPWDAERFRRFELEAYLRRLGDA